MAGATREIRRRIKSVGNTKKITKAMELVSAAKMRKAVNNVLASRSYSKLAWDLLINLSEKTDPAKHPLLQRRELKRIGMIIVTSNRGLCGSFNSQLLSVAQDYITRHKAQKVEVELGLVLMGKKGSELVHRYGHTAIAEFDKMDVTTRLSEITPLSRLIIRQYLEGKYDRIVIAYTDYVSSLKQVPRVRQLLPLDREDELLGRVGVEKEDVQEALETIDEDGYIFEPGADVVLEELLSRMVEMQIYQAILESDASEHSARMLAMRNATDAANDMITDLTLAYNQARQSAITQEIAEISASTLAIT
ncbi:ATP synthase F1 subunit gamma [Candidatus Parcubacteria bacterium]|nr:MAG: ATP synthase F1 subunit gamma [Candidatus Parcubacteria bacterium]